MKVGLIPGRGLELYALRSDFHLTLPVEDCMNNEHYVRTYRQASARGDYIVLDNGAADGGLVSNDELMEVAHKLDVHEIVAPDVFYDKAGTVTKVKEFIRWLSYRRDATYYKVMAVAQGTSVTALRKCIDAYSNIREISVVGLPRHLLTTLTHKAARIDMANWIREYYVDRFEIHLLGTNPVWLREVASAAKYAPHIRSVDTALPFNYALASQNLETTRVVLTRNPEYFLLNWFETASERHINNNINTFLGWANGTSAEETSSSELRDVPAL